MEREVKKKKNAKNDVSSAPRHDPQKYGGRISHVKQYGPVTGGRGALWKKSPALRNRALAVFEAQQFSRREWKGRDYDVVEMPYGLAPLELQRVIPEIHTEYPLRARDGSNLRHKVYDRDGSLAATLFGKPVVAVPEFRPTSIAHTLDKLFSME